METIVNDLPQTPYTRALLNLRVGFSQTTIVIDHKGEMIIAGKNSTGYYITIESKTTPFLTIDNMRLSLIELYTRRYCVLEESIKNEIEKAKTPVNYSSVADYYNQIQTRAPKLCAISRFKFETDDMYIYATALIAPWIHIRFITRLRSVPECVDLNILDRLESRAEAICAIAQ